MSFIKEGYLVSGKKYFKTALFRNRFTFAILFFKNVHLRCRLRFFNETYFKFHFSLEEIIKLARILLIMGIFEAKKLILWYYWYYVPVWLNGWVFVYELSSCGFELRCCHLDFVNPTNMINHSVSTIDISLRTLFPGEVCEALNHKRLLRAEISPTKTNWSLTNSNFIWQVRKTDATISWSGRKAWINQNFSFIYL